MMDQTLVATESLNGFGSLAYELKFLTVKFKGLSTKYPLCSQGGSSANIL